MDEQSWIQLGSQVVALFAAMAGHAFALFRWLQRRDEEFHREIAAMDKRLTIVEEQQKHDHELMARLGTITDKLDRTVDKLSAQLAVLNDRAKARKLKMEESDE